MNYLKQKLSKIKKAYALYYFIIVLIIFLPTAVTMPSLSFRCAIITAIGVDKQDEDILVSVLTLSEISKSDMRENTKLLQGSGTSLANAVANIESAVGRQIKMGHVGYIVISQDFKDENIANILDLLIVAGKVSNTVPLLLSNGKAKDILDNAQKMEQSSSYKMREMINNEFNETYTKDISIDSFLKGYYSDISISTLGLVTLESDAVNGIDSSQGQQGGQQSSTGGGEKDTNTTISYKTEHAVFNKGKLQYVLSKEEMRGVNWLAEGDVQKIMTINNISEQGITNGDITFFIGRHKISPKVEFVDGKPYIEYNISLTLLPIEIQDNYDNTQKSTKQLHLSNTIKQKINEVVKNEVSVALNKLKEEKTDVIGVYKLLYNHYKQFMNFLDTLSDKSDFLKFVNIGVKVSAIIASN